MKFKELFGQLHNEKVNTVVNGTRNRVGTIPTYDELVNQKMASIIRGLIQKQYLIVKPSVGQGYYGDIPCICIRSNSPRISPNTPKGIYVVLLFDNIGDTFYLCLSQGYTFFETKYPVEHRREVIRKTVEYFQNELRETLIKNYGFSVERINLGENITSLGRGYEEVTIIAKKFQLTTFDESDFFNSLIALVQEYEEIITHIRSKSYEDIIELINPDDAFTTLEKAFEDIENTLVDEVVEANDVNVSPIKVEKGSAIPSRFNKISQPKIYKKVDYIKQ